MQSFSSRIWTRVVVSISYDDNHYTTFLYCSILKILHVLYVTFHFYLLYFESVFLIFIFSNTNQEDSLDLVPYCKYVYENGKSKQDD